MPSEINTDNTRTTGGNPLKPVSERGNTLLRVVDGDTLQIDKETHRIPYIDTEESVHPDQTRNTPKGAETSQFMKNIVPSTSDVSLDIKGQDKYGRNISQATRLVNGVEVDWGLVVMDQDLSHYVTSFGEAPDEWHEVYKQYYSKYAPYQYNEVAPVLTDEQLNKMATKEQRFQTAYTKFIESGEEDRTELDAALSDLYGNPAELAEYRHATHQARMKEKVKEGGAYAAWQLAEQDPTFRELYNRGVMESGNLNSVIGRQAIPNSFWERMGASYNQISMLNNISDLRQRQLARQAGREHKDTSIPVGDISSKVPENYAHLVEREYNKYGATAAELFKDQLLSDIENNKVFDSLPIHKQLGYGALSILADPLSYVTGGVMGKGVTSGINAASKLPMFARGSTLHTPMQISAWGAGASIEAAVYDAPALLGGDLEYTGQDYVMAVGTAAVFGGALSGLLIGGGKWLDTKELRTSQENYLDDLNKSIQQQSTVDTSAGKAVVRAALKDLGDELVEIENTAFQSRSLTPDEIKRTETIKADMKVLEETEELGNIGKALNGMLSPITRTLLTEKLSPNQPAKLTVADLFEVKSVDRNMFNNVLNLARKQMDNKGDLFNFLKRQAKLNKVAEERGDVKLQKAAGELNATLVKLASMFPDGKLPPEARTVLAELRMNQQRWVTNDVIADILEHPGTPNQLDSLNRYVNKLKEMDLWLDGMPPEPMSWLELAQYSTHLIDIVNSPDGRSIEINRNLPKDMEFLHDVVRLNNEARKSGSPEFVRLVDEINGMVANRLEQRELGVGVSSTLKTADKTKWFPSKVKRSAEDVRRALKESGIEQFTPEYVKARAEQKEKLEKILREQNPSPQQAETARKIAAQRLERRVQSGEIVKHNPEYLEAKRRFEEGYEYLPDEIREVGQRDIVKTNTDQKVDDARSQRTDGIMHSDESKTGSQFDTRTDVQGEEGRFGFDEVQNKGEFDFRDPMSEEADLLPRKFNEPIKSYAYDSYGLEDVEHLNNLIKKRVLTKYEEMIDVNNKMRKNEAVVMERVVSNMTKDFDRTLQKAKDSQSMDYMFAIIRGSETLARKQRTEAAIEAAKKANAVEVTPAAKRPEDKKPTPKPEDAYKGKELTEEDMGNVIYKNQSLTPDELSGLTKQAKLSHEEAVALKVEEQLDGIQKFVETELPSFKAAIGLTGKLDWLGRKLSFLTKDIATTLQTSNNPAMAFIGFKVTELGRGFGGNAQRGATGGLIKHRVLTDLQTDFMPQYVRALQDYATSKGSNMLETMNAQQMTGSQNPIVKQFNQEFMWLQEMRRMGHELPASVKEKLKHVIKFADEWDKMMGKAHKYLVDSKIEGFNADRKVNHYVPRIHKYANYKRMIEQHGEVNVRALLGRSIRSADPKMLDVDLNKRVDEFLEWILRQDGTTPVEDLFMPHTDTRSMSRMPLDMTVEYNGMKMFDLVNDEVMEIGMKYSNRVAGWVGLSDSTNGMLNSNLAIDAFREIAKEAPEGRVLFDDVVNMMFGRPTRNGLAEEIRHFKDLTALSRMGGLGTAQLVESGNVITKSVINMFSDPAVAKRLFDVAKSDPNDKGLLAEIQAISRLTDDMEYLQRQSVNLEQSENIGMQPWRKHSIKLADTITFGKYKAPASRLLGKVTGFNAVRRYQSRVAQTGFTLNVVRHFTDGKSAISPKRLADLGLTTPDGKNTELANTIKQFVEVGADGLATKLNFDKWPKNVRDQFTYALLRDEAQNVQKSLVGELPAWYNKPLMALAFQFRQFPIVAQNKQLGRALAMADKEAVVATLLNAATAGLVRTAKAAAVAGGIAAVSSRDYRFNSDPEHLIRDASKYVAQFGVLADATDFVTKAYKSYDDDGFSTDLGDTLLSFTPIWGVMKDYKDLAAPNSTDRERVDAAFGVVPLGNILFADMLRAQAQEALAE